MSEDVQVVQDFVQRVQEYARLTLRRDGKPGPLEIEANAIGVILHRMAIAATNRDKTIERLTKALRVNTHTPHDQDGPPDPESGFPVCSVCGAIQTEPDAAEHPR